MNAKQRRNLKKVLKHQGFTADEIERELLKRTAGNTSEATPTVRNAYERKQILIRKRKNK
ncbi:hypothetical protein [Vibrio owensii]|uniref:Uncharacterized protein n=1 Tax=Vibrio owensii CAIM 1854 = LMG 25443 TaxID=1229493 RepID=A0A0C1WCL5_9VIBR|nr:hypothetical protein [Vibrio owensii]KIF54082.1 hypothetical protein H735_06750 [Vibrio owensii CAIM 1854 = LMG 25443]